MTAQQITLYLGIAATLAGGAIALVRASLWAGKLLHTLEGMGTRLESAMVKFDQRDATITDALDRVSDCFIDLDGRVAKLELIANVAPEHRDALRMTLLSQERDEKVQERERLLAMRREVRKVEGL